MTDTHTMKYQSTAPPTVKLRQVLCSAWEDSWAQPTAAYSTTIMSSSVMQGAVPMGSADWEVQRVAAGVPGFGTELTGEYTPFEAGVQQPRAEHLVSASCCRGLSMLWDAWLLGP